MKKIIASALIAATTILSSALPVKASTICHDLPVKTVYVTNEAGEMSVYKGIPDSMDFAYPVHVEYVTGTVTDDDGCGHIDWSSDGVTEPYTFIKYYGITSMEGDEIDSVFVYRTDSNGNWEDDIVCRIDITDRDWDGTTID